MHIANWQHWEEWGGGGGFEVALLHSGASTSDDRVSSKPLVNDP